MDGCPAIRGRISPRTGYRSGPARVIWPPTTHIGRWRASASRLTPCHGPPDQGHMQEATILTAQQGGQAVAKNSGRGTGPGSSRAVRRMQAEISRFRPGGGPSGLPAFPPRPDALTVCVRELPLYRHKSTGRRSTSRMTSRPSSSYSSRGIRDGGGTLRQAQDRVGVDGSNPPEFPPPWLHQARPEARMNLDLFAGVPVPPLLACWSYCLAGSRPREWCTDLELARRVAVS